MCDNNNKLITYGWIPDKEIQEYKSFLTNALEGKISECPYSDPDSEKDFHNTGHCYLKRITEFLNKRIGVGHEFLAPVGKYGNTDNGADNYKICMKKENSSEYTPVMLLTTDQFGFSGPHIYSQNLVSWDERYPYASYLLKTKEKGAEFVAKCIRDTRTIGGSFLWPVKKKWDEKSKKWDGKRKSCYNLYRGIKSLIEDRVDLTLLEIKHFYEYFSVSTGKFYEDSYGQKYLESDYLLSYSDKDQIIKWLSLFGSFENYVDKLMFHPFVVCKVIDNEPKYYPIDICKSVIKEDGESEDDLFGKNDSIASEGHDIIELKGIPNCEDCKTKCKHEGKIIKEIQECLIYNPDKLKRMLNNVRLLTLARSKMMTDYLENCKDKKLPQWKEKNGKWIFE